MSKKKRVGAGIAGVVFGVYAHYSFPDPIADTVWGFLGLIAAFAFIYIAIDK
jgi:hypothetical protein